MYVYDSHVGAMAKIWNCGFDNHARWVGFWSFPIGFQVLHQTVNKIFTANQGFTKGIWENQVLKANLHSANDTFCWWMLSFQSPFEENETWIIFKATCSVYLSRVLPKKEKNSAFCMNWRATVGSGALLAPHWVQWGTTGESPWNIYNL